MPRIIPCRRRSNGVAASSTRSSVAAAPEARNPDPSHGSSASEVASSAETTTTRRQRPARIQSSATAIACVVLAHAALTCVFGPRAPMISANCECPIDRHRNRKRRSNTNGSVSRMWRSSGMRRSTSAAAGSSSLIRDAHRLQGAQLFAVGRGRCSSARGHRRRCRSPGKAEAKMTPVSSRIDSGSPHRSGSLVPSVVVL